LTQGAAAIARAWVDPVGAMVALGMGRFRRGVVLDPKGSPFYRGYF